MRFLKRSRRKYENNCLNWHGLAKNFCCLCANFEKSRKNLLKNDLESLDFHEQVAFSFIEKISNPVGKKFLQKFKDKNPEKFSHGFEKFRDFPGNLRKIPEFLIWNFFAKMFSKNPRPQKLRRGKNKSKCDWFITARQRRTNFLFKQVNKWLNVFNHLKAASKCACYMAKTWRR